MKSIIRNIRDLDSQERRTFERVLGEQFKENQQIIVQIIEPEEPQVGILAAKLPDWCNVFAGLSDEEIADVEAVILQRANLSRPSE